jgi:type III restriction enzyme
VVQLYRDYLLNFMINKNQDRATAQANVRVDSPMFKPASAGMKVTLFDFQRDALHPLRDKIVAARKFASTENPQAIAFSAPTGSGKTIMMTALFEAILDQPDDELAWPLDWAPQPDAVILWVSDMPELNEQTKLKIESKSDKVYRVSQLVTIDAHFDAPQLEGGRIYFINTQKARSQPAADQPR